MARTKFRTPSSKANTSDLKQVNDLTLTNGRMWTDDEETRRANVVVLGL